MKKGDKVIIKKPEIKDEVVENGHSIVKLKKNGWFHKNDIEPIESDDNDDRKVQTKEKSLDKFFGTP